MSRLRKDFASHLPLQLLLTFKEQLKRVMQIPTVKQSNLVIVRLMLSFQCLLCVKFPLKWECLQLVACSLRSEKVICAIPFCNKFYTKNFSRKIIQNSSLSFKRFSNLGQTETTDIYTSTPLSDTEGNW